MSTAEEREADRISRMENRRDRRAGWADTRAAEADSRLTRARQLAEMIPLGQPIITGRGSRTRADINTRARISDGYDKGIEAHRMAERHASVAEGIDRQLERRETAPVILRRIERMTKERAAIMRSLTDTNDDGSYRVALGEWSDRLVVKARELNEDIAYWQIKLAALEAAGVKIWGPSDFTKGERVRVGGHLATVERVNAKTLTLRYDLMPGFTRTAPYNKVNGKVEADA